MLVSQMKFPPGKIVITTNALEQTPADDILNALHRHAIGDWGDVCAQDRLKNELSPQRNPIIARTRQIAHELTQIKRHRGRETEGRQKGSLTHGKKTPANGVNEHEQGTENRLAAEASSALLASQPRGQKPDVGRDL
jgi:hypothetical protein